METKIFNDFEQGQLFGNLIEMMSMLYLIGAPKEEGDVFDYVGMLKRVSEDSLKISAIVQTKLEELEPKKEE